MVNLKDTSRFQAFAWHTGISLLIFSGLIALILLVWYPSPLRELDSSWKQALTMIASVDLVLGPMLTLLIFDPTKKNLKTDLSIIAVIQITALVAGIYTVHQARPVALLTSFPPAGFRIISANMLSADTLKRMESSDHYTFYYNGSEFFGPTNTKNLSPTDIQSTSDGYFIPFISSKAPIALFQQPDNTLIFPVENAIPSLRFDQHGKLLGLQIAK